VLADDCGIVVLPARDLDAIADAAIAEQEEEGDWLAQVAAGKPLGDLVDLEAILGARVP